MKDKLLTLEEAAQTVRDGTLLGLTGSTLDDAPMAFLREVLRQRRQRLRVVTMSGGGLNIDLLIGAGAVGAYDNTSTIRRITKPTFSRWVSSHPGDEPADEQRCTVLYARRITGGDHRARGPQL